VAGTPLGTGPSYPVGGQNGLFLAGGRLYWAAESTVKAASGYPVGLMCLDLTSLTSCGFTRLDEVPTAAINGTYALISGTGLPASDGNYYYFDQNANALCFNPATGPCGIEHLDPALKPANTYAYGSTFGSYVFGIMQASGSSKSNLYCYDVSTAASCPGYPKVGVVAMSGNNSLMVPAPVLDPAGNVTGVCLLEGSSTVCWNLSGVSTANPYSTAISWNTLYTGDTLAVGTRVYAPTSSGARISCWDFANYLGTGTVPACAGFTSVVSNRYYTSRPVEGVANCLIGNSDLGGIVIYSALTGGPCSASPAQVTATPAASYCGTGAAGWSGWNTLTLTGLDPAAYRAAFITISDANGTPVPGFVGRSLPAGITTLDISSIPRTGATASLTAAITLDGITSPAGVTSGEASLSWAGDPVQMCFETTAPRVVCGQSSIVANEASAVTTGPGGSDGPGGNSSGAAQFTLTPAPGQCQVEFSKTASPRRARPGSVVTYTVTARNTGTVDYTAAYPASFTDDLTGVLASASYGHDAKATAGSVSYAAPVLSWSGPLAAGATATITYSATVKAAGDVSGQDLANTVVSDSAGSSCPAGAPAAACTADVPVDALTIAKSASPGTVHAAGDVVTYSFTVTNTGSEPLHGITVADTQLPPASEGGLSAVTCPVTTLAAGESTTCTATYPVTQADVDHGSVHDSATVTGTPPAGPKVTSTASAASVTAAAAPGIGIVKSASASDVAHFLAGQVITYTFVVTNTGNVTLHDVRVTDTGFTGTGSLSAISCPDDGGTDTVATLAPGTQALCTATYTLTTADVDAGTLSNTGNAAGAPPTGPAVTAASTIDLPAAQNPALSIVKSAVPGTVHVAGDVVTYHFRVTNTGNTTLHEVTVDDTQLPPASQGGLSPVTCPSTTLAPGQFTRCTATYTVTQADVDHGSAGDSSTASGISPAASAVTSPPSAASVTATAAPEITVVKSASPSDAALFTAGQLVSYTFEVTNAGNVTLAPVTVADTGFTGSGSLSAVSCPDGGGSSTVPSLAPGTQTTCTATYTLTQADVDAGAVADTGNVAGTPPAGPAVTADSTITIPAAQDPALTVEKSASPDTVRAPGEQVSYTFTVTNTGNVTLHNPAVDDTQLPPASQGNLSPVTCPGTTLVPGQFTTCTATYTVTQADIDHDGVTDSATASGTPPSGTAVTSPAATATVTAAQTPAITVLKSAPSAPVTRAGQQVRYSFLVTDTGNVTLRHVGVADVVAPPADSANLSPVTCPHATLAPGASQTCTATYTVTAADLALGAVGNTATAYGTPPSGTVIRSRPHTISFSVTGVSVVIPTGLGAAAAVPGASPGLAAAGAATLAAGLLLIRRRTRRRVTPAGHQRVRKETR
jgi:uncharacterized repeat protein (TIGR01451 family)